MGFFLSLVVVLAWDVRYLFCFGKQRKKAPTLTISLSLSLSLCFCFFFFLVGFVLIIYFFFPCWKFLFRISVCVCVRLKYRTDIREKRDSEGVREWGPHHTTMTTILHAFTLQDPTLILLLFNIPTPFFFFSLIKRYKLYYQKQKKIKTKQIHQSRNNFQHIFLFLELLSCYKAIISLKGSKYNWG